MKLNEVLFEESEAGIDSRNRNIKLIIEFEKAYLLNCKKAGYVLTNTQNTKIFLSGVITRLIHSPVTHHAGSLKRISEDSDLYVAQQK